MNDVVVTIYETVMVFVDDQLLVHLTVLVVSQLPMRQTRVAVMA